MKEETAANKTSKMKSDGKKGRSRPWVALMVQRRRREG